MSEPSSPTTPELEKRHPDVQVSPTGTPVVPASWVPWLSTVAAVSGAVVLSPTYGLPTPAVVVGFAGLVNLVALIMLGQSPGLRK